MARLGSKRSSKWSSALLLVALVAPMISAELPRVEEVAALAATGAGGDKPIVPFLLPAVPDLLSPTGPGLNRKLLQADTAVYGGYLRARGSVNEYVNCGSISAPLPRRCKADAATRATLFNMFAARTRDNTSYLQFRPEYTTLCLNLYNDNGTAVLFVYPCTQPASAAPNHQVFSYDETIGAIRIDTGHTLYYAGYQKNIEARMGGDPVKDPAFKFQVTY